MDTLQSDRHICRLDELTEGEAIAVDAVLPDGPENLIIIRRGERVHAYMNICPHAGRRLDWAPGKFLLKNDILVCAAHGASFQAQDGLCVGGPCRGEHLRSVAVRVTGEDVVLD
ncbi:MULTISPECIES: Rieske (2Fe-2S) protein [Dyella]|uniref:Rieske (2Fe-2S) protein n=2 Tax=Dyella TaxID=231454 RepID=A0A4R0YNT5_9GAMM|nr:MULTISPECIES: Rieske (2Fe-2S) protein [Dyella]TBR36923.1 Rieske (2Fe-2S) protein [Dyella terrae]TCI07986.1 Rieske (2Fe-2S) protein [Dyella soli]